MRATKGHRAQGGAETLGSSPCRGHLGTGWTEGQVGLVLFLGLKRVNLPQGILASPTPRTTYTPELAVRGPQSRKDYYLSMLYFVEMNHYKNVLAPGP